MEKLRQPIKALGEIVLRVKNLQRMQEFYENVIGLEILGRSDDMVFFKIAPSYAGHFQILGLFEASLPPDHSSRQFTGLDAQKTSLHHIAFTIGLPDFAPEKERMEKLGLIVETMEHEWTHWRSMYFPDPEDNLVELVCYDESVQ